MSFIDEKQIVCGLCLVNVEDDHVGWFWEDSKAVHSSCFKVVLPHIRKIQEFSRERHLGEWQIVALWILKVVKAKLATGKSLMDFTPTQLDSEFALGMQEWITAHRRVLP